MSFNSGVTASMRDAIQRTKDKLDGEADRRVALAFYRRFGELSDQDIKTHGLRKCYPDRDVYFYKEQEVITVYRPLFEWNEERDKLNVSLTFIEK